MKRDNDLDNFDPNKNQNNERGKNPLFANNRVGHEFSGRYNNSNNNNPRYNDNNSNRRNYGQGERPRFGRGPPHFHNSNFGGGPYRDQRYRRENYGGNYYPRGNYNYDNRGYNTDRRYGDNSNFDREFNRENNDYENEEEREAKLEKERLLSEFKKKYGKIIEALKMLFFDESLKEEKIIDILKIIKSNPNLTIYELNL